MSTSEGWPVAIDIWFAVRPIGPRLLLFDLREFDEDLTFVRPEADDGGGEQRNGEEGDSHDLFRLLSPSVLPSCVEIHTVVLNRGSAYFGGVESGRIRF